MSDVPAMAEFLGADAPTNRWTFLYVAAPLKVVSGTGAPVNPAIR